jgi:hypothetical protein
MRNLDAGCIAVGELGGLWKEMVVKSLLMIYSSNFPDSREL